MNEGYWVLMHNIVVFNFHADIFSAAKPESSLPARLLSDPELSPRGNPPPLTVNVKG